MTDPKLTNTTTPQSLDTSPIPNADSPIQLLMLGTGTSTGLPLTPCLTLTQPYPAEFVRHLPLAPATDHPAPGQYDPDGEWPNTIPCACCRAAVSPDVPEGWKNKRGNTSVIVRKRRSVTVVDDNGDEIEGEEEEGEWRNVIVDVGKTFREQSAKFFPRWGITRIDAVILTHGHADAYFGLDDLREWCFRQNCVIPVYLNRDTYEAVGASFPYLVDRKKASGGGDVPALRFHIIEDDADFEVEGIRVRALPVEHGIYFRDEHRVPLICLGFMFDESIIYMSDVSDIPAKTWERMMDRTIPPKSAMTNFTLENTQQSEEYDSPNRDKESSSPPPAAPKLSKSKILIPPTPVDTPRHSRNQSLTDMVSMTSLSMSNSSSTSRKSSSTSISSSSASIPRPLPVLIIDALWPLVRHSSHIHMVEALRIAMKLKPSIMYLVDLVHPVSHYMWEEVCASVRGEHGAAWNGEGGHPDDEQAQELVQRFWEDRDVMSIEGKVKEWAGRVEPGWDGLVLEVNGNGGKEGEGYEVIRGKKGSGPGLMM